MPDSRDKMYVPHYPSSILAYKKSCSIDFYSCDFKSDKVKILMSNGVETTFPLGRTCSRGFEVLSKSLEGHQ